MNDEGAPHFFTVGYGGIGVDELVELLKSVGVATLVDIRFNAVSQFRPEFSKRNLEASLSDEDIDYIHLRHLGVPSDVRGAARADGDPSFVWKWYAENVVPAATRNLDWFFNSASHPIAFMCSEAAADDCHRQRLASALAREGLTPGELRA